MTSFAPAPEPAAGFGHVHDYGLDDVCVVTGCGRERPGWLEPADLDDEPETTAGPDWGQRILLVVLALTVSFGLLHYMGAYVTKATEKPSTSSGYLDLPPEVGTVTPGP